jgi:putative FmdB family regulatory protein
MPIYEYRCSSCGVEFEKMIRFSEAEKSPVCPACQSQETMKKLSTFASFGNSSGGFDTSSASNCGSSGGFS